MERSLSGTEASGNVGDGFVDKVIDVGGRIRIVAQEVAVHCKECQRQSGSAFGMSVLVKKDGLTVSGPTKQFTRIADSDNEGYGCVLP